MCVILMSSAASIACWCWQLVRLERTQTNEKKTWSQRSLVSPISPVVSSLPTAWHSNIDLIFTVCKTHFLLHEPNSCYRGEFLFAVFPFHRKWGKSCKIAVTGQTARLYRLLRCQDPNVHLKKQITHISFPGDTHLSVFFLLSQHLKSVKAFNYNSHSAE